MAIDENRCQKCFRGHLDRLHCADVRYQNASHIYTPLWFPSTLNKQCFWFLFWQYVKCFFFPSSSLLSPPCCSSSFTGFWSNSVNWKVSQAPHPIFIMVYNSGGIGLYLTTKVIHHKYYKQLKEPGGQQCHLGRKILWTSRIAENPMRRVLDKFLAASRLFHH